MSYNAITDFVTYCSCYQIPRNFAIWSGVGLMAAATNRRIYIRQGDILHHGQMYIWLVGEQGDKKSTPKGFAEDLFKEVYETIPVGASVQSREQIVEFMVKEGTRTFTNENNEMVEYHPMMFFINEVENFLSFNMAGMISFLVDIYDKKFFDSGTIKRGLEAMANPCINVLGCCTPKWLSEKMKSSVITGGICRRTLLVYEIIDYKNPDTILIPRPFITPEAREARDRVRAHLDKIRNVSVEYKWGPGAQKFFDDWYFKLYRNLSDDPIVRGYEKSKDVQLLKLCMNWDMANENPSHIITVQSLETGLAMLDSIQTNLSKLSVSAGRNELAGPQHRLMDMIEERGGKMPCFEVMAKNEADLTPGEMFGVLRHLVDSRRLKKVTVALPSKGELDFYYTLAAFNQEVKEGKLTVTQSVGGITKTRASEEKGGDV